VRFFHHNQPPPKDHNTNTEQHHAQVNHKSGGYYGKTKLPTWLSPCFFIDVRGSLQSLPLPFLAPISLLITGSKQV